MQFELHPQTDRQWKSRNFVFVETLRISGSTVASNPVEIHWLSLWVSTSPEPRFGTGQLPVEPDSLPMTASVDVKWPRGSAGNHWRSVWGCRVTRIPIGNRSFWRDFQKKFQKFRRKISSLLRMLADALATLRARSCLEISVQSTSRQAVWGQSAFPDGVSAEK